MEKGKVYLNAMLREKKGKEAASALRKEGSLPAVIYGQGKNSLLSVSQSELIKLLHHHSAESTVISLQIQDGSKKKEANVLIKELQRNPVGEGFKHVDFYEISLTKKIKVKVPLVSKGEPEGVKHEDGALEHLLWELEIECLPTEIPENIEVDVSKMQLNESLAVKDVIVPEGIKVFDDPEQLAFSVKPPREEKPEEESLEGAEAEAEPEVIKQKTEEEIAREQAEKQKEKEGKEG